MSVLRKPVLLAALAMLLTAGVPLSAATQADCTGTYAYGNIADVSHGSGVISADGYFSVGGGATDARLDYFIDGSIIASEDIYSTSGYWDISDNYSGTCEHEFSVKICPKVCDGGGCVTCLQHCTTYDEDFIAQPCAPSLTLDYCDIDGGSTGVWSFQASASGGVPDSSGTYTYKTQWYQNGAYYTPSSTYSSSPWDYSGRCSTSTWTVGLRVIDHAGQYSNTVTCPCGGPAW